MRTTNVSALLVAVGIIVAAIIYLDSSKAAKTPATSVPVVSVALSTATTVPASSQEKTAKPAEPPTLSLKEMRYERAKELTTPDGFINTSTGSVQAPITIGQFIGKKVVLLDIWTYSCINCQRTLPYLKAWWEKYKDKGLMIIGLHTPEFEFEKKYENVLAAVEKFGITYPVALDNDYSTWRAYRNQYWPRKYLIDIDGYIVYDHIGEGGYEETERQIQKVLAERMERLGKKDGVALPVTKESAAARPESPETYFGAFRNENFGNGARGTIGEQTLAATEEVNRNTFYLVGDWNITREYAENKNANAQILFKYKARDVYFVASSEKGVRAALYLDGGMLKGKGASAYACRLQGFCGGEDVSANGTVFIKEDRLYKLIQHDGIEEHTLKIEIESPGLKAFTFTFG